MPLFIHGDLEETVYMQQPPGFVDPQFPSHVCRLRKALYGLKQSPRAWFHKLQTSLLTLGFTCSQSDPSLFIHRHGSTLIFLLVYVDDIIITGNNTSLLLSFIRALNQ